MTTKSKRFVSANPEQSLTPLTVNSVGECFGTLNQEHKDELRLPDHINEVHICRIKDKCYLLRTTVKSPQEIEVFLKEWTSKSKVVWRVNKTCPKMQAAGIKNLYWKEFRCQNSNCKISKRAQRIHKKHTNCPAQMAITVKRISSRCRSRDPHLPKYPTIIKINNNHNHKIDDENYLKNRPVSDEVKKKFLNMYRKGHTPLSAIKLHKIDLKEEYGDCVAEKEVDRSLCPDNQWCYRLFATYSANKEKFQENIENIPNENYQAENISNVESMMKIENIEISEDDYIEQHVYQEAFVDINQSENDDEQETYIEHYVADPMSPFSESSPEEILKAENCERIIEDFASFVDQVQQKVNASPELFLPALQHFVNSWKTFDTDLDFADALQSFGKR